MCGRVFYLYNLYNELTYRTFAFKLAERHYDRLFKHLP
jgi:hypothetical protein